MENITNITDTMALNGNEMDPTALFIVFGLCHGIPTI